MNPKELRQIAIRMLQLADALDASKVQNVDGMYAAHDFIGMPKGGFLRTSEIDPVETVKAVRCKHDFENWAFYLTGAYCEVSKTFFVNDRLTHVLCERLRVLKP